MDFFFRAVLKLTHIVRPDIFFCIISMTVSEMIQITEKVTLKKKLDCEYSDLL